MNDNDWLETLKPTKAQVLKTKVEKIFQRIMGMIGNIAAFILVMLVVVTCAYIAYKFGILLTYIK